jgi:hypothetical protein
VLPLPQQQPAALAAAGWASAATLGHPVAAAAPAPAAGRPPAPAAVAAGLLVVLSAAVRAELRQVPAPAE